MLGGWMRRVLVEVGVIALMLSAGALCQAQAQQAGSDAEASSPTLRVNARAVVVDVIVTDSSGKPVTGLSRDAFKVTDQGKTQKISFFEENKPAQPSGQAEIPKMPPDVFTNFSPFPQPPAVNVLLLDSLNTRMENQSYVHAQALKFLKTAKPGTRSAIFAMGLGLHFIQGFNDDPGMLAAALNNKKNNEVESSVMLKGQDQINAEQKLTEMMSASVPGGPGGVGGGTAAPAEMIAALQNFIAENDTSRSFDRIYLTMENLQKLATFLEGFPGRKNIIWFAETVPSPFLTGGLTGNPGTDREIRKTLDMLATARAAIYPVDPRGTSNYSMYTAENNVSAGNHNASEVIGVNGSLGASMTSDDQQRNADQESAQILAKESGGRAFANMNSLSDVIAKVTSESSHFYTLSYSPTDEKMDGRYRKIGVEVSGGKYKLSYRRGYFATDTALPGNALALRDEKVQKLAAENPGQVDPLLQSMDLGMPQSEQILLKARIVPVAAKPNDLTGKDKNHYSIDFAIDLKDLTLKPEANGMHTGALNVSLIVYDRYGGIIKRQDHLIELNPKPDAYKVFQQAGVQLHFDLAVPNGNYWLRTGIYDRGSRKVGTMELPLSAVKPLETATAGSK
jgi:VWFA-related protein